MFLQTMNIFSCTGVMFSNHPPLNDVNASKKRGKKSEIEREILEVGADEYE